MTTVKDILIKARAVIAEPEHWCKGWYAKDKEGREPYEVTSEEAFMFCSLGAIRRVLLVDEKLPNLSESFVELRDETIEALASCIQVEEEDKFDYLPEEKVVNFNDSTDHEAVLKAFDCAINSL